MNDNVGIIDLLGEDAAREFAGQYYQRLPFSWAQAAGEIA